MKLRAGALYLKDQVRQAKADFPLVLVTQRRGQLRLLVRELLNHKVSDIRAKLRELRRLETELGADLEKCNKEPKHRQRHEACACPQYLKR